jgi:cell wall-associated NlpC family hydrolase
MPGGAGMLSGLSGLTGKSTRHHHPHAALVSRVERRADQVPGGPGEVAVRAALGKQGRPYVWGAKGPNSFDCSGLTGWAWRQAGIQLGADTYQQIHDGVAVPPGQVRAGDLIFPKDAFDARGPGHRSSTHRSPETSCTSRRCRRHILHAAPSRWRKPPK